MELRAQIATLRLAETFVIARESQDVAEVVQVELRHGDVSGFGEAAPIERYDESAASALAWLEPSRAWRRSLGAGLRSLPRCPPVEQAARAALDAALYDLQGKLTGLPVYKLLGLQPCRPADLLDDLAR